MFIFLLLFACVSFLYLTLRSLSRCVAQTEQHQQHDEHVQWHRGLWQRQSERRDPAQHQLQLQDRSSQHPGQRVSQSGNGRWEEAAHGCVRARTHDVLTDTHLRSHTAIISSIRRTDLNDFEGFSNHVYLYLYELFTGEKKRKIGGERKISECFRSKKCCFWQNVMLIKLYRGSMSTFSLAVTVWVTDKIHAFIKFCLCFFCFLAATWRRTYFQIHHDRARGRRASNPTPSTQCSMRTYGSVFLPYYLGPM